MLIVNAGVMTGVNPISVWTRVDRYNRFSVQAKWTGNPVGAAGNSFIFAGSNDDNPNLTTTPNLLGATPLTLPTAFASGNPAGAAGSYLFEFESYWDWFLLTYTNASGSGLLYAGISSRRAMR